tara:strand:+ start:324 stop:1001 length:678 start_codon:yes stop_codon:yes gene_type:complete
MKTIAIIPARGKSKGIKNKNLVNFCGKPLIYWTIKQALSSKLVDEVIVSSDSNEIINISKKNGAQVIRRPKSLSGDKASSESALIHVIKKLSYNVDLVVFLQVTSPLRKAKDIDNAIKKFIKGNGDSLFSASSMEDFNIWIKNNHHHLKSINYNWKKRERRQEKKNSILCENGSIYITKRKLLEKRKNRLGGNILYYKMENWQAFEIDEKKDIKFVELLFKGLIK